jgi:hypothetical protein
MYKIIGADQKEYGPVTANQLRHWIQEGRVNGQTRARAEGATEWQTLSDFAEFADLLAPGVVPPPSLAASIAGGPPEAARSVVKAPAIALVITAILNLLLGLVGLLRAPLTGAFMQDSQMLQQFNDPQIQKMVHLMAGPIGIVSTALQLFLSALVLIGAIKMLSLRNYVLSVAAAIVALVPCATPCCVLTLPFGIWALVVLNRPDVKANFR